VSSFTLGGFRHSTVGDFFVMAQKSIIIIALVFSGMVNTQAAAPTPITLDEIAKTIATTTIKVEKVGRGLYVFFGAGGNIAVSIGENGTLIVDSQYPQMMPKIMAEINALGGSTVDFAINTHWHFDHADGNQALGPQGTWLISQTNSRKMMQDDHIVNLVTRYYEQKAYPAKFLPVMTYDNNMQFHFNGETIDLLHYGAAHTTGDTAVYFREHNVVHMGDVYFSDNYPFIDVDNGGSIEGLIQFCEAVLNQINPETTVIPGHGSVTDYKALQGYIEMLQSVRERISALILKGSTLEDVYNAKVTIEWDKEKGNPSLFIDRAYQSLVREVSEGYKEG